MFVEGLGGYALESIGSTQEDFDRLSLEQEILVTKLKQVGLCLQLSFTA